jgi:hypothetical protein
MSLEEAIQHYEGVSKVLSAQDGSEIEVNEFENLAEWLKELKEYKSKPKCNQCKYYEGVHGVKGHAPCKKFGLGGVLWNDMCPVGEFVKEVKS